jgi:5-methylcytosine-specific restriction endonuclease McrA
MNKANRRKALLRLQEGKCFYCGDEMCLTGLDRRRSVTFDEVVPRARGGKQNAANVVLACKQCNEWKDNRLPTQAELSRLAALLASPAPR